MGVGGRDVDPRDRFGCRDDARCGCNCELGQLLHMRGLGRKRVGARLDNAARFLVKFGRVEAHHACQRLTVREAAFGRHQSVGVPGRDLDMIAEHRIVPDLERRDLRRIAIAAFERGDGAASVRRSRA